MTDTCRRESRQLGRRARSLGSQKATKIASEGEPPSQTEPTNWDLLREALLALARKRPVVAGDPRQHIPGRSGREAVDLPVAVAHCFLEAACRYARGAAVLFPRSASNHRKNGAKRGRWCMNRNWPATNPTHRSITYQERTTMAYRVRPSG